MNVKELSDKELKDLVQSLHIAINEVECYGVRDLMMYEQGINELENRDYVVNESITLTIS